MMATTNPEATAVGRSSTDLQTEGRRKRAVITGSNGGMGRALARAFGASSISGCDIRVDGAAVPALQEMLAHK